MASLRDATAFAFGAGVVAAGFPPVVFVPDKLGLDASPERVVATPAVLLAVFALVVAARRPRRDDEPLTRERRLLGLAVALLALGVLASLTSSNDVAYSIVITVLAFVAPVAIYVAVRRSDLPSEWLVGGFIFAAAVFMLRADVRFFEQNGFPTGHQMFLAKFSNAPYDFHYYGLGNPDGTAAFALMPLVATTLWLGAPRVSRWLRAALAIALVVELGTIVMLYSRSASLLASLVLVAGVLVGVKRHWAIHAALAAGVSVACAILLLAIGATYQLQVFSVKGGTSGGNRVTWTYEGFQALTAHLLTGRGVGRYNEPNGFIPAHSALVQAGAEMGIAGFVGFGLLVLGALAIAVRTVGTLGLTGAQTGAAVAAAVFLAYCTVAGAASEAAYSGYVSVWALGLALMLGVGARPAPPISD